MILLYLRIALFLGFVDHAYKLSDRWGHTTNNVRRYNAAAEIQKELQKRGFHECPYCHWSTRKQDEHLENRNGWCYAEAQRNLKREMDSWLFDDEYLDLDSLDGMPDRMVHNAHKM